MDTSQDRLIVAGALGFAIVTLVQLSSASTLGNALLITSFALVVSVPTLTAMLIMIDKEASKLNCVWYPIWIFGAGMIATWIALVGLFFHLHYITGFIFTVLSFVMFLYTKTYEKFVK